MLDVVMVITMRRGAYAVRRRGYKNVLDAIQHLIGNGG
jgi:hypothetical protein